VSTAAFLGALHRFAGIGANRTSHLEKWVSGIGGLAGILGVLLISQAYLGLSGSASLVASMGASAVLLFAVPHGPLSQPWAVLGGHLVSAIVGVACIRLELAPIPTAALAVALAISAMYYLRCIHPPGGATALSAVVGGESVHALGFHYVLTPVLLNVLVILSVAILFNLAFPWRRYPAAWARKPGTPATSDNGEQAVEVFSRESLANAARAIDPALGISKDNVETICTLALCNTSGSDHMHPVEIHVGGYYCNGTFGPDWQVRQVIDVDVSGATESSAEATVFYRVVAGNKRRQTSTASREAFADWACYEVYLNETSWQRVNTPPHLVMADNAA
jgi:CBS domain-containing membrane protein